MKHHLIKFLLLVIAGAFCLGCKCGNGWDLFSKKPKYETYQDAVQDGNFEAAYDMLNVYRKTYHELLSEVAKPNEKSWKKLLSKRKVAEGDYYQAFDYIYKGEVSLIMSSLDGQDAVDKIVFLLGEIPVEGEKLPAGECHWMVGKRDGRHKQGAQMDAYIVWTQHYNTLCNNVLKLAINRKNRSLAQQVPLLFVDNVAIHEDSPGDYSIHYYDTDSRAAKKKYDEAVAMGLFD